MLTYLVGELWRRIGDTAKPSTGSTACRKEKSTDPQNSTGSSLRPTSSGPIRRSGSASEVI